MKAKAKTPDSKMVREKTPGRIITFYSYKGGTGRSMALANVAWILASAGLRVLVIDWDLEAPGLHRYFRPFLSDPELVSTPGLIDFFAEFVEGSRRQKLVPHVQAISSESSEEWFEPYTDLLSCACSLDFNFPNGGTLDFVPAGRQGPTYAALVGTFQWRDFYERMGGGVFLEAVKKQLQGAYDFVLIDSRTGLSDTSGICTVQMPDDLVVCFTLNRQSIFGAAGAAESAMRQRTKPDGGPGLRVWPVPTRIDQTEKEKLDSARTIAQDNFTRHLWHLTRQQRAAYWGRIEVFYVPFYAYMEILAVAADRPTHKGTLLSCMEQLTEWITDGNVTRLPPILERDQELLMSRFTGTGTERSVTRTSRPTIYFSYAKADFSKHSPREFFERLRAELPDCRIFWDEEIPLGENWKQRLPVELKNADIVVFLIGPAALSSSWVKQEMRITSKRKKLIVPVLINKKTSFADFPKEVASYAGVNLGNLDRGVAFDKFVGDLQRLALKVRPRIADPEDPQKGRWGGESRVSGRELTAKVQAISSDWFSIQLRITPLDKRPVKGIVEFHLHDTFDPDIERVEAQRGEAELEINAVGAFTVGVLLEDGTTLELDLATLKDAPQTFRER